jgi:hypothetical protein
MYSTHQIVSNALEICLDTAVSSETVRGASYLCTADLLVAEVFSTRQPINSRAESKRAALREPFTNNGTPTPPTFLHLANIPTCVHAAYQHLGPIPFRGRHGRLARKHTSCMFLVKRITRGGLALDDCP